MNGGVRVLDLWCHIEPAFGGVGPAAAQLAAEVGRAPGWTSLPTAICGIEETFFADGIPANINLIPDGRPRPIADIELRRVLRHRVAECDVCHVHGLWLPHTLAARQVARTLAKPILSSVHGMLERWELANKGLKKQLYSFLFERASLAHSACLRALSHREAEDYRRYGLTNPIAVVPNGICPLSRIDPDPLLSRYPQLRHKCIVLYLSRIHYKKGILNLLRAWASVAKTRTEAHLLVAGPDCEGTLQAAKRIVERHDLIHSVTFCGTISGHLKLAALSAARYFCLPSYSEGLSVSVLEALSIGLPVIVTEACNIDAIADYEAGQVTSNEPAELAAVLSQCLNEGETVWHLMSRQAERLARERYDWTAIGQTIRSVYSWVLGGSKPSCIID